MKTSESRKVFRVIVQEFIDCFHEVKHFSKMYPEVEMILPAYKIELNKIIRNNKCKEKAEEIALIDIAFSFFYFGVSKESETILLHKFYNRYNREFTNRCKVFLQLKPKEENDILYAEWKNFKDKKIKDKLDIFKEIYPNAGKSDLPSSCSKHDLYKNFTVDKYYGGHQHRLGHYFRHLFQSYKFLSSQEFLKPDEKYYYGKLIRAQLSTYEQLLILFNSLSSLGMRWEYTAEIDCSTNNKDLEDFKFISRYNIIKNLPGSQYYDFTYRRFYPNVNYEYMEDITYSKKFANSQN